MKLSISPSIVDSWEYYVNTDFADPEQETARLEELVAQIRGERWDPSPAVLLGRMFHAVVECPDLYTAIAKDGTRLYLARTEGEIAEFDAESIDTLRDKLPAGMLHEVPGKLELPEIGVEMSIRADGVAGLEVHEIKTTSRVEATKYACSAQWLAYLLAFSARVAVYHVCRLQKERKSGVWSIAEYMPLRLYAYPAMRDDLVRRVAPVRDFIIDRGLADYRRVA